MGPEEKIFEVFEGHIKRIPCFKNVFDTGTFREGQEGHLRLPEDDPLVFSKLLQFIRTGDYFPRIVLSPKQCEPYLRSSLFQHQHFLEDRVLRAECERRYDESRCGSLECTLEVIVDLEEDIKAPYQHRDAQFGRWRTADETHSLFEQEVLLFCMAERFMMEDLKTLCLSKIFMFPLGPRELATLAQHVPGEVYEPDFEDQVNTEMHRLFNRCIRYHQRHFDEWRPYRNLWRSGQNVEGYAEYLKVIEGQMTAHGVMLFHAVASSRATIEESVGNMYLNWECRDERIAVCRNHYSDPKARLDWQRRNPGPEPDWEGKGPPVQSLDNLYPGFEFCEAHEGDTIIRVTLNKPIKGLAYGFNVRADGWGWYPQDLLRFLETKSYRDCPCHNCEPPTFKVNGRGPRLYMHDPEGKGLEYRPGTRQTDLEGWRKFRER